MRIIIWVIGSICFFGIENVNAQNTIVLKTHLGYLKGTKESSCWIFKGIPYAEKLTKKSMFLPPVPKKTWKDTLDCSHFGNRAPQYDNKDNMVIGNENCLYLNLYTPNLRPQKKMPVLVWVHGGSMTNGQGSDMDGHAFADRDGIVTITINYRLGILGFLYLNDVQHGISGNNGLLDLITALQYIQKNVTAFGGNPNQITVMGESAGAKLVSTLLLTSLSKNLFKQMVLESGGIQCVRDTTTAKAIRQRLLDTLRINDPKQLLRIPLVKLIDAQNKIVGGAKGTNYFGPVADDIVIPKNYMACLLNRNLSNIRFLIGSNKSESRLFMNMDKRLYQPSKKVLEDWFGFNGMIVDSALHANGKDTKDSLLTEYMYAMHTHRLALLLSQKKRNVWLYRFDYDAKGEGATHGQELPYVWYRPTYDRFVGKRNFGNPFIKNGLIL